jgi:prephenate dehydrogenase
MLGRKITIIGGSGSMGQVFGRYFKSHGFKVTLNAQNKNKLKDVAENLGVNYEIDLKRSVQDAEIVIVSIPIHSTGDIIKKIAPLMKRNALILDITSLKHSICSILKDLHKKYPINCLSIHPMFGPGIQNMKNYIIIVIKIGGTEQYDELVNQFLDLLPHMFNILFLNLLKRMNESLSELTRYTGTTFLLQKVFAESIIQREMEMFGEIQIDNDKFHTVLDKFEDLIKEYKNIIKNKDMKGFKKLFNEGLEYSKEDTHFNNSYKFFYEFMKILKEKKN